MHRAYLEASASPSVPAPLNRPTVVLTNKGTAVRCAYRLLAALRALGADDHAAMLALLALELADHRA